MRLKEINDLDDIELKAFRCIGSPILTDSPPTLATATGTPSILNDLGVDYLG